jgi:hypothetical protein
MMIFKCYSSVVSTMRMFLWALKRGGFIAGSGCNEESTDSSCMAGMKNTETLAM